MRYRTGWINTVGRHNLLVPRCCHDVDAPDDKRKDARRDQGMKREDLEKPVTLTDFEEAIVRCQRSVGNMDVSKYERWIKEYGSY